MSTKNTNKRTADTDATLVGCVAVIGLSIGVITLVGLLILVPSYLVFLAYNKVIAPETGWQQLSFWFVFLAMYIISVVGRLLFGSRSTGNGKK